MKTEYSSNNSGGRWWLTDEHWRALEAAGWKVAWHKDLPPWEIGERTLPRCDENGRWLGSLAATASKDFETPADAIREFERITGKDVSDDGCNCCGPPHSFRFYLKGGDDWEYGSGSDLLRFMFKKVPGSLREAAEALSAKESSSENR